MRTMLLSLLCLLASTPSFAAERRASDTIRHTSAAEHHYHGDNVWALGVSDTTNIATGETLTALFSTADNWVQTYLGVFRTKDTFTFSAGGAYKFTVAGTRATGFHVGPGIVLGTVSDSFAFGIFGAAGGHFTVADHLFLSVDGGPAFVHISGKDGGPSSSNFVLRGFGPYLGLTIAYVF